MIEFKRFSVQLPAKAIRRSFMIPALGSFGVLLLSGCGAAYNPGPLQTEAVTLPKLQGIVHGGQFPVSGSIVSLYEVGATPASAAGYGASIGSPIATATAPTDANGNWSISSIPCVHAGDELYLVASGGNPGLTAGTNNSALTMTSVAGLCGGTYFATSFDIDEVTTVATEYALAGFSTGYLHVGTSTGNTVGLINAFAAVTNLVNLSAGKALSVTPAYAKPAAGSLQSSIAPASVINTLANVLATCINTASPSSAGCANLFAIAGGSLAQQGPAAANTADAALYIAHNPGLPAATPSTTNLTWLFSLPAPIAPFGPALASAPNDYTMTLTFTGGGFGQSPACSGALSTCTVYENGLAIDQDGSLWIPLYPTAIAKLSNLGVPVSSSSTYDTATGAIATLGGYQTGLTGTRSNVAIDLNGNAWVVDEYNCLAAFSTGGTALSGSPFTSVCGGTGERLGIGIDAGGNVWFVGANGVASVYGTTGSAGTTGALRSGFPDTAYTTPVVAGADYSGNMWFIDGPGNEYYGALNGSGTLTEQDTTAIFLPAYASNLVAFGQLAPAGRRQWRPRHVGH